MSAYKISWVSRDSQKVGQGKILFSSLKQAQTWQKKLIRAFGKHNIYVVVPSHV